MLRTSHVLPCGPWGSEPKRTFITQFILDTYHPDSWLNIVAGLHYGHPCGNGECVLARHDNSRPNPRKGGDC